MNRRICIICKCEYAPKIHNQKCCSKKCKRKREMELEKINKKPPRGGFNFKLCAP